MYNFSKNTKVIINENRVIIANIQTGRWAKITKESYEIIKIGIENKKSIDDLKLMLFDDEDRLYIENIYQKLYSVGLIETDRKLVNYKNKLVSFEITNRCNLSCIHCCIDADGIKSKKKELTTKEVKNILSTIVKWSPDRIMLSGGEPMLRSDFTEILIYLKSIYDGKILVSTNGTLINKNNIDILKKCAYQVDISLDGVDEKTCSIVRGKGVFDRVIENIKLLQSTGFENIYLSLAVGDKNKYLEDEFNKLNKRLKTKPLIRIFTPTGRGLENNKVFSNRESSETCLPSDYLSENYDGIDKVCNCTAGDRQIFIRYDGDVYPCPSAMEESYKLGNILETLNIDNISIHNIKNKNLEDLKPYNIDDCKLCKVNLFCWSCPGEYIRLKDNKIALKHRCKRIKPILYKRIWGENI